MKTAVLFSVPMTTSDGDCWRWRSADGKTDSTRAFTYYEDCCKNAQANGYCVSRAIPMSASWQFFAVSAHTPSGFTWQWEKRGAEEVERGSPFSYYFDCISDARKNGYAGPLPAGPKVPLAHLPIGRIEPAGASSPLSPQRNAGKPVLTLAAVSAADSKKRRAARSRVT